MNNEESLDEIPLDVNDVITYIFHPMIDYPLTELGLIREYKQDGRHIHVIFAFPFPNIPIKTQLISSVEKPLKMMGYTMDYEIELMTEPEKMHFMELEKKGWKK